MSAYAVNSAYPSQHNKRGIRKSNDGTADSESTAGDMGERRSEILLNQQASAITVAYFSPDASRLITGTEDGNVHIYDLTHGAQDSVAVKSPKEIIKLVAEEISDDSPQLLPRIKGILTRHESEPAASRTGMNKHDN